MNMENLKCNVAQKLIVLFTIGMSQAHDCHKFQNNLAGYSLEGGEKYIRKYCDHYLIVRKQKISLYAQQVGIELTNSLFVESIDELGQDSSYLICGSNQSSILGRRMSHS